MTSGRRAKQLRADGLRTPTEAKEIAEHQLAQHQHPLGPYAGAFATWQNRMKANLLQIMAENRAALEQCDGTAECTSPVHVPGCLIHPL